jgi:glutaredoxin-like protein
MLTNEFGSSEIVVYSTSWCPDCHRTKHFLTENGINYVEIDVDKDAEGLAFVRRVNQGHRVVPTVVFPDGTIYVEPPNSAVAAKLGLVLAE